MSDVSRFAGHAASEPASDDDVARFSAHVLSEPGSDSDIARLAAHAVSIPDPDDDVARFGINVAYVPQPPQLETNIMPNARLLNLDSPEIKMYYHTEDFGIGGPFAGNRHTATEINAWGVYTNTNGTLYWAVAFPEPIDISYFRYHGIYQAGVYYPTVQTTTVQAQSNGANYDEDSIWTTQLSGERQYGLNALGPVAVNWNQISGIRIYRTRGAWNQKLPRFDLWAANGTPTTSTDERRLAFFRGDNDVDELTAPEHMDLKSTKGLDHAVYMSVKNLSQNLTAEQVTVSLDPASFESTDNLQLSTERYGAQSSSLAVGDMAPGDQVYFWVHYKWKLIGSSLLRWSVVAVPDRWAP